MVLFPIVIPKIAPLGHYDTSHEQVMLASLRMPVPLRRTRFVEAGEPISEGHFTFVLLVFVPRRTSDIHSAVHRPIHGSINGTRFATRRTWFKFHY